MASFIMAGRLQAIAFASLFAFLSIALPPLAFFSSAAVALVTLRQGVNQGIIVSLVASAVLAVAIGIMQADFIAGFSAGLQQWLPMVLFAAILMRTVSWTYTLQIILLIAVGGLIIFHLSVSDTQLFWKDTVEEIVRLFTKDQPVKPDEVDKIIVSLSTWATAGIAVGLTLSWIISLFIARYWQALLYKPNGFGEEFRELRVGRIPAIGLLLSVLIFVFAESQMMADISIVGMSVFLFQGLGIMHYLVKKLEMSHAWLVGTYVLMVPFFSSSSLVLILMISFGIIDNFTDFRNKLTAKD